MGYKVLNEEQEKLFIECFPNKTNKEMMNIFNLNYDQVANLGSRLRLRKSEECSKRCKIKTKEHMEKLRLSHLGYKMPQEQKDKISASNLGREVSDETRQKLSISKIGDKNPMKRKEVSVKVSQALTGRKLPKEVMDKLQHHYESNPNFGMRGKYHSEETKDKISKTKEENEDSVYRPIGDLNVSKRPEMRKRIKEMRAKMVFPKKDSSIEVKIQNFLKELNIDFFTHQYIKEIEHGYQCDILIPYMNLIIECDGDYWHHYPIGREIDHIRTKELIEKGFKVLRIWEFEINQMSIEEFKSKLCL